MSLIFGEIKLNQTPGSDDVQSLDIAESLIQAACRRRAKVGFESGTEYRRNPSFSTIFSPFVCLTHLIPKTRVTSNFSVICLQEYLRT